eukprot:977431-Rhodomonas_salina.1
MALSINLRKSEAFSLRQVRRAAALTGSVLPHGFCEGLVRGASLSLAKRGSGEGAQEDRLRAREKQGGREREKRESVCRPATPVSYTHLRAHETEADL